MTTDLNALAGADGVYLVIGSAGMVELRCDEHPQYSAWREYGKDRKVPVSWILGVLAAHLPDHAAVPQEESSGEPARPLVAAAATDLDSFGREVAARCRWAMDHNDGTPDDEWELPYRLAVAVVLGNHQYLQDIGPGPGYSPMEAVVRLVEGMARQPADLDAWIESIRAAIRRPDHGRRRQPIWLPVAAIRTE